MDIFLILLAFLMAACSGIQSRYHALEPGETLSSVARRFEIPEAELREKNRGLVARGLKPGTKLYIPFEASRQWNQEFQTSGTRPSRQLASFASGGQLLWPVPGGRLSSAFGPRRIGRRGSRNHEGIDIAAPKGTAVKAARAGHVIYVNNRVSGYGNMIILKHRGGFATVYAHLSRYHVKRGQFVARGQTIGQVGKTGHATSPHLHFEVRDQQTPLDPLPLLETRYTAGVSLR